MILMVTGCAVPIWHISRYLAPNRKRVRTTIGFDTSHRKSGAFATLAILLEVSVKVLPRPDSEITLTGAMGIDRAIPLMSRWARSPLPCPAQCTTVRHSGYGCPASGGPLAEARAAMGGLDLLRGGAEQRLPFFRDDRPLWRVSLPRRPAPSHCLKTG